MLRKSTNGNVNGTPPPHPAKTPTTPTRDSKDWKDLQAEVTYLNATSDRSTPVPGSNDPGVQRSSTVDVALNSAIAEAAWQNPVVQNAMHVLEQLSDVGKVVPFAAPAFVVLKLIIDVERRAKEVDAKCNDLLERSTFMLSLFPMLREVQVNEMTQHVIERIIGVLKTSASLIQAYRKQGALARRLNVKNRDKFTSCAGAITQATSDLMFALQIHQTGVLEILGRAVPVDAEDTKAEAWLDTHGGADAVRTDPALVSQFANTLHISMDDGALDQINENISSIMQQNQAQIETLINENVSAAVVNGLKEIAELMAEREREPVLICVQCENGYRNSENGVGSCHFHKAEYDSWSRKNPCCGQSTPCQTNFHRPMHHCEYAYSTFFPRAQKITNYVDTRALWIELEDLNLETNDAQKASVGQLLRWATRTSLIEEPTIVLSIGGIWHTNKYFFDTWTAKELAVAARVVAITNNKVIFRNNESKDEFTQAEWVLSTAGDGSIAGILLTAKAATSDTPYRSLVPIDATGKKVGEVQVLSKGGFHAYTPLTPYELPENVVVSGGTLPDKQRCEPRKDFKTRTTPALPVVLKAVNDPPLEANPQFASTEHDNLEGAISIFNKHQAGSNSPVTIAAVSASFRLVGDETYSPIKGFTLRNYQNLPVTIDPRESWTLGFEARVPRSAEDAALEVKWWNRAFGARHRPIRLKITLEDIEGAEASIVLEYVLKDFPPETKKDEDLAYFFVDDLTRWSRYGVHVQKYTDSNEDTVMKIDGTEVKVAELNKLVWQAIKSNESEIKVPNLGQEKASGEWEWWVHALVDLSCKRVYAFKIVIHHGKNVAQKTVGCIGYVAVPDYGEVSSEKRPVLYAMEKVQLPELAPLPDYSSLVTDDAFDDYVPPPVNVEAKTLPAIPPGDVPGLSGDASVRLASIDNNLGQVAIDLNRLANAVEQLVLILAANQR